MTFRDQGTNSAFLARSAVASETTAGVNPYPVIDVDISSASHPFYTGRQRLIDSAGQVEKFRRRYGRSA